MLKYCCFSSLGVVQYRFVFLLIGVVVGKRCSSICCLFSCFFDVEMIPVFTVVAEVLWQKVFFGQDLQILHCDQVVLARFT